VAVLLETNAALREPKQSISGGGHTHRLKFAAGSHQAGICDPSYFDYLWNPQQLRGAGTNPGRPLLIIATCWAESVAHQGGGGQRDVLSAVLIPTGSSAASQASSTASLR
jgi:hypothetical protein